MRVCFRVLAQIARRKSSPGRKVAQMVGRKGLGRAHLRVLEQRSVRVKSPEFHIEDVPLSVKRSGLDSRSLMLMETGAEVVSSFVTWLEMGAMLGASFSGVTVRRKLTAVAKPSVSRTVMLMRELPNWFSAG